MAAEWAENMEAAFVKLVTITFEGHSDFILVSSNTVGSLL